MPPPVSVIIPTYNAEKTIAQNLLALVKQQCPSQYEIIVVDDGSNDSTAKIVEKMIEDFGNPKKVRLIRSNHRGPAAARNIGIKEAQSDIVLFTDADCTASEKWISSMVEPFFTDPSVAGVGGTYQMPNEGSMTGRFVGYDIAYRHTRMSESIDHIGTYSAAFLKKALLEVGLFDESFTQADSEDNDISYRLTDRGYKLIFQPKGLVCHLHPSKVGQFLKRQFQRAYWRAALYAKHPRRLREPDKYTTWQTQLQPFVWVFLCLFLFASLAIDLILIPFSSIAACLALVLLNAGFLKWSYSEENSFQFLIFSSVLCILRSFVWALGGFFGILRFGGRLKSR
jgi:glycosyltransferase involved in cell wall biosynthesis